MSLAPRSKGEWLRLAVTSGLAAAIAAVAGSVGEFTREGHEHRIQQCQLAASFLQDHTPAPYLNAVGRQRALVAALARFERCMKE